LLDLGMTCTADAVRHSTIVETGGTLRFATPKDFRRSMGEPEIRKALAQIGAGSMKIAVEFVDGTASNGAAAAPPNRSPQEDTELADRALSHPEVKRFRELFGGQVRAVRNLKE